MAAALTFALNPQTTVEDRPVEVSPAASATIIETSRLTKAYGRTVVLDQVDLAVAKGEFLTLLGPSGSGKTTLLSLIAGTQLPSSGSINLYGRDISRLPPEHRNIGVVFQNYALFPHMTAEENVAFPLRMRRIGRSEIARKVKDALELTHLSGYGGRYPRALSGGQQQRVALARALVFEPSILLMDEPLSALDKKLRDHMKAELREIQRLLNLTVIYVTHDQAEALALSSRMAVMNAGRILQMAPPAEIYEAPKTRFVADFVGEANFISGRIIGFERKLMLVEAAGTRMALAAEPAPSLAQRLSAGQISVMIRPERIAVGAEARAAANRFRATIRTVVYEGAAFHLTVDLVGTPINIRIPNLAHSGGLQPGTDIDIGWGTESAHLVDLDD